jgi:Fic family protein
MEESHRLTRNRPLQRITRPSGFNRSAISIRSLQHIDRANQALGRLDGLTTLLPDTRLFLYLYVRKEALLSSQIEGTKSSFSDLLLFENEAVPGVPIDDVEEVSTQHS